MDTTNNIYKPKQMRLRTMPKDVYDIIVDEQAEQKKKCNCGFGLEQTIYKIIRSWKKEKR